MHHPMPTEAIGQKKTTDLRHRSENRMVIGRHLVKPSPGPLGIDREVFENRYPICGARQDFFYKRRLEVGLEARCFVRIIPSQKESQRLRPAVKSVCHVDNHRSTARELIEGFGRNQHPPEGLYRQLNTRHLSNTSSPRTRTIY